MTPKELKQILQALVEHGVNELTLETPDYKLTVRRGGEVYSTPSSVIVRLILYHLIVHLLDEAVQDEQIVDVDDVVVAVREVDVQPPAAVIVGVLELDAVRHAAFRRRGFRIRPAPTAATGTHWTH